MKYTLAILPFLFIFNLSWAGFDITPGLWQLDTQISQDGKKINPQAEMNAAMAKMTPEQRKQVEIMMAKTGTNVSSNGSVGTKVCYTEEMLKNNDIGQNNNDKKCQSKTLSQSNTKIEMEFSCSDGTIGKGIWTTPGKNSLQGNVDMEKSGKKSQISYIGKFITKDCGNIKPITNIDKKI